MRRLLSNGLVVVAGLIGLSEGALPEVQVAESKYQNDPRLVRLKDFFQTHGAPAFHLAADFLAAADRHNLDWRLLPSICWVESGCGKRYRKNNLFGWDSSQTGFSSIRESVHRVADRLANSKLYRNKGLESLLFTYNSRPGYAALVQRWMRKVDPLEPAPVRDAVYSSMRMP